MKNPTSSRFHFKLGAVFLSFNFSLIAMSAYSDSIHDSHHSDWDDDGMSDVMEEAVGRSLWVRDNLLPLPVRVEIEATNFRFEVGQTEHSLTQVEPVLEYTGTLLEDFSELSGPPMIELGSSNGLLWRRVEAAVPENADSGFFRVRYRLREDGLDDAHPAHQSRHELGPEHEALIHLVPNSMISHVAISSGDWSNNHIWLNGQMPGEGANVVIPRGVSVTVDSQLKERLFVLRVDGHLRFAPDRNTRLLLDTMIISPSGKLTMGTADAPIQSEFQAEIIILNNGPIDTDWDFEQLSRGVISHGEVEIHGWPKTPWLAVASAPMQGDTELVLASVPDGWKVGDRLVLTGTRLVPWKNNGARRQRFIDTEDEALTVTAISANRVTFAEPLQYNHDAPRAGLRAYVGNFSRNVRFASEDFASLPANQRGHTMFMHSDKVDVRYAEFFELGRTDKSEPLDDILIDNGKRHGSRVYDSEGNPVDGARTNVRGRYSFHFHRTGVGPGANPGICIGNAVWGSPGWGFVHHDSHAIMNDNVAYNVFGAAFVSETGNETGEWNHNLAIRSEGTGVFNIKMGAGNHDVAHHGAGFWFQSRLVSAQGNVAAGCSSFGFAYFHRGEDRIPLTREQLPFPEVARYLPQIDANDPEIIFFENNEAIACGQALHVARVAGDESRQGHDRRSWIRGLLGWEVEMGMELQYTRHYSFDDIFLLASREKAQPSIGIRYGNASEDFTTMHTVVDGFDIGLETKDGQDEDALLFLDVTFPNSAQVFDSASDLTDNFVTTGDLVEGRLAFEASTDSNDHYFRPGKSFWITGTKIDALGRKPYLEGPGTDKAYFVDEHFAERLKNGYYRRIDGTPVVTLEFFVADRFSVDVSEIALPIELVDFDLSAFPELGLYKPANNSDQVDVDFPVFFRAADFDLTLTSSKDQIIADPALLQTGSFRVFGFEGNKDEILLDPNVTASKHLIDFTFSGNTVSGTEVTLIHGATHHILELVGVLPEDVSIRPNN